MTIIKQYVDEICDELESAKEYAERYVELKSRNNMPWANKFKDMSQQELNHSTILHDYAMQEIESLRKVYTPPVEMEQIWNENHKKYVEEVAWIKQMLLM